MNKKVSYKRAFVSYDALFSIMPLLFLLLFVFQIIAFLLSDSLYTMQKRELFNTLVAISDYVVKIGAVEKDAYGNFQPNLINEGKIPQLSSIINNGLAMSNSKIKHIVLSLDNPTSSSQMCIYRLVVVKNELGEKEIKKLYICGDYANA